MVRLDHSMMQQLLFAAAACFSLLIAETAFVDPSTTSDGITVALMDDPRGLNVVADNEWEMNDSGSSSDPLFDWALNVNLAAETYGFKEGSTSAVTVSVSGSRVTSEADVYLGISIGEHYVTYAFDIDGVYDPGDGRNGVFSYPYCSSGVMATGDVSTLFSESNLDSSTGLAYTHQGREAMCGGDYNCELLTSTTNGHNSPWVVKLLSDDVAKTLQISFWTPTYESQPLTCTWDVSDINVLQQDIDVYVRPDFGHNEVIRVSSVEVDAVNVGAVSGWQLASTGTAGACISATTFATGYEFNPPFAGEITGVKLVHKSGSVNCNTAAYPGNNWGCNGDTMMTELIKLDSAGNVVYYPTSTTDGVSTVATWESKQWDCANGCSIESWYSDVYNANSEEIIWMDESAPYLVDVTDSFSLQYSEGCCDYATGDNGGTSCADVYFYYIDEDADTCDDSSVASFDWDELMAAGAAAKPAVISFDLSVEDTVLDIVVALTYEGRSSADEKGAVFGTTYVLDFEDFYAHSSSISAPGTCSNRNANDFTGDFSAWWDYPLSPADDLGSPAYLAYPPPNAVHGEWTVTAAPDDECGVVVYTGRFTWNDLTACTDATGNVDYITARDDADGDGKLKLKGTFYVNVVSPYAPTSDGDSGYYRVYQLISQPFVISVNKNLQVLQSAGINLFTTSVIAVYKDSGASEFKLVVLTESAEYLQLSRTGLGAGLAMFSSSSAENSAPQAEEFTVALTSENGDENGIGCLNNKDYICSQLWQIEAPGDCSDDQSQYIDFSGNYTLQFTPVCRAAADLDADGVANSTALNAYCAVWLAGHPEEAAGVGLTATLQWRDQECDPLLYEVQFEADMTFYTDADFSTIAQADTLYQVGEGRIYVEVDTEFPTAAFDVFDSTLLNVWICTFDPLNGPLLPIEASELSGGCFSDKIDGYSADADFGADNLYAYHIYDSQSTVSVPDVVAFDSVGHPLDATTGDAINDLVRFSFVVPPQIARDTLYIHAQIEVSLTDGGGRRRRQLLGGKGRPLPTAKANQMEHFLGNVGVSGEPQPYRPLPDVQQPHYEPLSNINVPGLNTGAYPLSLQSPWMMAIVGLLAVLLTFNIVYMCYSRACRGGGDNGGARVSFGDRSKRHYKVGNESEMDDSEAQAMNAVSE